MKNLQETKFLMAYAKQYGFDFIDHPSENAFSLIKRERNEEFTVKFNDKDISLEDQLTTVALLDDEMGITKNDQMRKNMNEIYGLINAATVGTIIEASYQKHFMIRVKNALNAFLGENPSLTVDQPIEDGSILRWTFREK